ncbi:MAG: mannonate dehydratase [Rhodopseudomonas palustris]|nr:mannonate dehydratase [Rhodopseudomonas palustris]
MSPCVPPPHIQENRGRRHETRARFVPSNSSIRQTLRFARQAGVTHIVVHLPGYFVRDNSKIITSDQAAYGFGVSEADDPIWTAEGLRDLKALVNGEGLELEALENFAPAHWHDVLLDGPRRAEQMAHVKQILRDVGRAGIRTMGYSFTIAGVWGRTEGPFARGGARSVGFENPVQPPSRRGWCGTWCTIRRASIRTTRPRPSVLSAARRCGGVSAGSCAR